MGRFVGRQTVSRADIIGISAKKQNGWLQFTVEGIDAAQFLKSV